MKIWAHTLVKNEARWIWYSVESVIDQIDKILIWDTGSTDGTLEIIEKLRQKYPDKIEFREYGDTDVTTFAKVREEMLQATMADWVLVLDADEIWWNESILKLKETIDEFGTKIESVVVPTFNMVGDMFHYQEEKAGRYHLAGRVGHYNLRAFSLKIPGIHGEGSHGVFGWFDGSGKRIEERDKTKIKFIDAPYVHVTHLRRSDTTRGDSEVYKRNKKLKYEIGVEVEADFYYPESFFRPRPEAVPSVWGTPGFDFMVRAAIETPMRKIYRRTLLKNKQHGY